MAPGSAPAAIFLRGSVTSTTCKLYAEGLARISQLLEWRAVPTETIATSTHGELPMIASSRAPVTVSTTSILYDAGQVLHYLNA